MNPSWAISVRATEQSMKSILRSGSRFSWRQVGWSALLALTVGGAAQAAGPKLTGTVLNEAGKPLSGASVFIYTAAPKEGVGILCPSCYPDCRKQAKSDGQGQFAIEDMDG